MDFNKLMHLCSQTGDQADSIILSENVDKSSVLTINEMVVCQRSREWYFDSIDFVTDNH